MNYFDPDGKQTEGEEKENIWSKFLRFIGILSEANNKYEQPQIENDIDLLINSDELKGAQILNAEIDKVKIATVKGLDKIHDVAAMTSGISAIAALSSTSNPGTAILALYFTTISTVSGIFAASTSGLNWALTDESKYKKNFLFEGITIGIGAGANSIKAGEILTPENEIILRQIYKNYISTTSWGIGFAIER